MVQRRPDGRHQVGAQVFGSGNQWCVVKSALHVVVREGDGGVFTAFF
jgi:hypothetical protein